MPKWLVSVPSGNKQVLTSAEMARISAFREQTGFDHPCHSLRWLALSAGVRVGCGLSGHAGFEGHILLKGHRRLNEALHLLQVFPLLLIGQRVQRGDALVPATGNGIGMHTEGGSKLVFYTQSQRGWKAQLTWISMSLQCAQHPSLCCTLHCSCLKLGIHICVCNVLAVSEKSR